MAAKGREEGCTALLLGGCDKSLCISASPRRREAQPMPTNTKTGLEYSGGEENQVIVQGYGKGI